MTHEELVLPRAPHSKLPPQLRADAEVVLSALDDLIGGVGAEQPGPVDRGLIANSEAVRVHCSFRQRYHPPSKRTPTFPSPFCDTLVLPFLPN